MSEARWVAVIMAAGQGTRMRSKLPKVAHPLAGRPILRHVIDAAREAGVDDCVVVVSGGPEADDVRAAAGDGVRFAVQPGPTGTGGAVEAARKAAGDAEFVLIMNGDVPLVLPSTLRRLMAAVAEPHAAAPDVSFVPEPAVASEERPAPVDLALLTADVAVEAYGYIELARRPRGARRRDEGARWHRPLERCTTLTPASTRRARRGSGRTSR